MQGFGIRVRVSGAGIRTGFVWSVGNRVSGFSLGCWGFLKWGCRRSPGAPKP